MSCNTSIPLDDIAKEVENLIKEKITASILATIKEGICDMVKNCQTNSSDKCDCCCVSNSATNAEDKHQDQFYLDRTLEQLISSVKGGGTYRVSIPELAEALKKYIKCDCSSGGSSDACGKANTVSDIKFNYNPNEFSYTITYCDGHEDYRDLFDLLNHIITEVIKSLPPSTGGKDTKLVAVRQKDDSYVLEFDIGESTTKVATTLEIDLEGLLEKYFNSVKDTLTTKVKTDGVTILGDGSDADPLRAVGGGGSGTGGNVFTIVDFKRTPSGGIELKYREDGVDKTKSVSEIKSVTNVTREGDNYKISFVDGTSTTITAGTPINKGALADVPADTQATSLPTKMYGESREGLLGTPAAWGKVSIGSDEFLIPMYKVKV